MTTPEQEQQDILAAQATISKAPESQSSRAVFPDGKSEATNSLEKTTDSIRTELATLRGLQAMNPTPEREKQIFDLERKRKRSMSFAFLQTKGVGTDEQKIEQKKILEGKETIEKLKASDILLLKKKGVDLANLLLVPKSDPTGSVSRDAIKETDSFIVNFGENKDGRNKIDNIIGAGDILPSTVKKITINGVEGERRNEPRPGYYNDSCKPSYRAIHDGDVIRIVEIGEVDSESGKADEKWLHERRLEDMIDNDGKALSGLPEDKKLEEEAQKEIKQRKEIRESIGTMRKGKFFGTTDKPISETVKALKDLNVTETNNLLKKVFGEGPGTDLLVAIDNGSTFAIKRMIALAYHEGGLVFGRQNPDPASGFNIGTFQIGGTGSTRESSLDKYESCLQAGIQLAREKNIAVDYETLKNDPAQRDLLTHLGYIQLQRGGEETFVNLRDQNLSDNQVIRLMHHDIQGGIRDIGESVVAQIDNTKIDLKSIQSA